MSKKKFDFEFSATVENDPPRRTRVREYWGIERSLILKRLIELLDDTSRDKISNLEIKITQRRQEEVIE